MFTESIITEFFDLPMTFVKFSKGTAVSDSPTQGR